MDLKGLALLSLAVAALTVEAAPQVLKPLDSCPCPGGGCVCLDPDSCSGGGAESASCWSAGQVCCSPEDVAQVRTRRQTGNDAFLTECGVATPNNPMPWAALIYAWLPETNDNYYRLCHGVLIHPQVVLTSASCTPRVEDDDELLVYAGEAESHQSRLVTKLVYHEYYNDVTMEFDIALLYVDSPFLLGDSVKVLCLPQRDKLVHPDSCFSPRLDENTGKLQKTMMGLEPEVEDCVEMLPEDKKNKYRFPDYSSFCAFSRDAATLCEIDEGSSLMCPLASDPDRMALGGVASLAVGCDDASRPIFYTNTTYFASWLQVRLALVDLENFAIPP